MKRFLIILICLGCLGVFALPSVPAGKMRAQNQRILQNGKLSIINSNLGYDMMMLLSDGTQLVYHSALWISGIKIRRDAQGQILYWLNFPPTHDNQEAVNQDSDQWNPNLIVARDSLTSVGFDGDVQVYELLPAYNVLSMLNPALSQFFIIYNDQDVVLPSLMGVPSPLPFDPINSETFCFSIPQPDAFDTPGILTNSAYYYDICPFGTAGDRDIGSSASMNDHTPLGLAIHQESYAWNVQDHDDMLITRYELQNINELDAIENIAISYLVDADVGPLDWGAQNANDDVSGYVKGPGYEFAYSRDFDGDGGATPWWIANKIWIPDYEAQRQAWYWRVGDGPNDAHATNYSYTVRRTPNEKYWLATGRNPDYTKFLPLRLDTMNEYEQPAPHDTRFLNTVYGEADLAITLQPGEVISFFVISFVGESLDDLKAKSLATEDFMLSGFYIDPNAGYYSQPCLTSIEYLQSDTFGINWFSYTNPDHFELKYRISPDLKSGWETISIAGDLRNYELSGINPELWYEIKIGSVFYLPEELYLESETLMASIYMSPNSDLVTPPPAELRNYPNPFYGHTIIEFELKFPAAVQIGVYNLRGQKVRGFGYQKYGAGIHNIDWNGTDDQGRACSNGIYFLRLETEGRSAQRKMLIMR